MRRQTSSGADFTAGLNRASPWSVIDVRARPDYRLAVRFNDGLEGEVDLSRLIFSAAAGVFETLRDPAVFGAVTIEHGAVTFPGELDLAPDAMHDAMHDAILLGGSWTPE